MSVTTRSTAAALAALATISLFGAACGDDDASSTVVPTTGVDAGDTTAPGSLEISGAWARTSPAMADTGAAYMTITTTADDRVLAASVDPSIAASVEIHETVPAEADDAMDDNPDGEAVDDASDMDGHDMDGDAMDGGSMTMTMRELTDGLPLPAGDPVELAPGGIHLMLIDLTEPLVDGSSFDLELTLEHAGTRTVTVVVGDAAP